MAFPGESVVVEVGKCICNSICTKITTFFKFQPNTDSLRAKMKQLAYSKKNIEDDLESAGKQGKVATLVVKEWLPKVKDIEGQWNSMEEDITASQKRFCGCFPNCYLRYKLSKSSVEKIKEVKELIDTRANFPEELAIPNPQPESVQEMPGPSIVDQKAASELLDRLKELVLNDDIRKIGIWGMGGVGKTTLINNLNNMLGAHSSSKQPFDIIIWVTVSSILDLHVIQLQIASRLKIKEVLENERKESWAALLFQGLKKQKKFILILDDVWEKIDLDKVGIPQGLLGCKIVLTTRSLDVCCQMKTDKNIQVNKLNDEAGLKLFSEHVGELPDVEVIKSLAREVAKECNGLPLAIKVVGCSMRGKKRVEQWRKALRGLRAAQPRNIERVEEDVFGPLKWSYDSLQGKNIQPCFLYCSLFPEDFSIEEDELIRCWRAEGLIDESMNIEESIESGVDLIEKLKGSCMLEPGKNEGTVKMHDIVRDVAIWIASSSEDGNKFFVQSNMSWSKITKEGMHESINRASFVGGGLSEIPTFLATCSSLSTLFLQDNPLNKIPRDIFLGLKELRVLNLSGTDIESLPKEVGELRALRVLNLSGTTIKSLPKEVGELNNLRLLILSKTYELERIEAQTISRLSSLEVLDMYQSDYGWKVKGEVDEESVTLEELLHLEYLYFLRIRVSSTGYFPLDSTWLKRLKSFHFYMAPSKKGTVWLEIDDERVVELTDDVEHLAKCVEGMLNIATYLSIQDRSVNRIGELAKSVPNLKELILCQIEGSDNIWEGMVKSGGRSSFPKLQKITVIGCNGLKSLIPHDLLEQLHNLEEIHVYNCSNMKEIFGAKVVDENTSEIVATCSVVDSNALPNLRLLHLFDLSELRYICQEAFSWPSLEIVRVFLCPNLRGLPFSTGNAKKIQEIKGRKEWWNKLEWEDEETKLNLQKHFKEGKYFIKQRLSQ
ncbi:disease resistance protein At4g27190-like [Tasmannia lanceolata]|uniref:disease resistance protein At4g27190-like n=1 Tax=Tasmannia lanceolata TaxID=3420 RepID=UPI004062A95C